LEAAVESTAKEYESQLTQTKANQKRNEVQLEQTSSEALSTEDLKRKVKTQLSTLNKTFASIFTAEDGKCLKYADMFSSRKDARAAEMTNLNDAKGALAAYCESIGIRI
jgi:phage-related tail protein